MADCTCEHIDESHVPTAESGLGACNECDCACYMEPLAGTDFFSCGICGAVIADQGIHRARHAA